MSTKKEFENLKKEVLGWLPEKIVDAHVHTATEMGKVDPKLKNKFPMSYALFSNNCLTTPLDIFLDLFPRVETDLVAFPLPLPFKNTNPDYWNNVLMIREMKKGIYGLMHYTSINSMEETLKIAKKNNVKFYGIKIHPRVLKNKNRKDVFLKDLIYDNLLEFTEENKLALLLEMSQGFIKEDFQILKNIDENFKINVVVPHMGQNYRGFTISLREYGESLRGDPSKFEKDFKKLKETERIFFDTSMVVDTRIIKAGIDILGQDKIIYGSDFPFGFTPKIKEYRPSTSTVVKDIKKIIDKRHFTEKWRYDYNIYLMIKAIKDCNLESELVMYKNAKKAYCI